MAAQALVPRSYEAPLENYSTNVMGTINVLEAIRNVSRVLAVAIVTSDKGYENKERTRGYREDEAMGGYDPDSSSKGAAELVTAAYRRSFFSRNKGMAAITTARTGNVIGGGDWAADRLVPDFVRAACSGRKLLIRNPHAIRPWQHVLDVSAGYLILAQRLAAHGAEYVSGWNFGPLDGN